jgi:hypothetical protein
MPQKKNQIKKTLASIVLSLSLLLSSCASKFEFPKLSSLEGSLKTSVVKTLNRFEMQAESVADYYSIYEKELESNLEEKKHDLSYSEKRMMIDSLVSYDYLSRGREDIDLERYEKIEDIVNDISEKALKDAFNKFDFVIAIEEDLKNIFYRDKEENKPGISGKVRNYISDITHASKIDLGAKPSIRDRRIHFKTFAKLENVMGFSYFNTEIGTDTFEVELIKKLNKDWTASGKYEIDKYETKESEVVLSLSRHYGENTRLAITGGWGKPLKGNNKRNQEGYIGLSYIKFFK